MGLKYDLAVVILLQESLQLSLLHQHLFLSIIHRVCHLLHCSLSGTRALDTPLNHVIPEPLVLLHLALPLGDFVEENGNVVFTDRRHFRLQIPTPYKRKYSVPLNPLISEQAIRQQCARPTAPT